MGPHEFGEYIIRGQLCTGRICTAEVGVFETVPKHISFSGSHAPAASSASESGQGLTRNVRGRGCHDVLLLGRS